MLNYNVASYLLIYLAVQRLTPHAIFKESQDLILNSNENVCDQYTFRLKYKN